MTQSTAHTRNIYMEVERVRQEGYDRVTNGELTHYLNQLAWSDRLAIIVEEVGEVAQAVKSLQGFKPKLGWTRAEAIANMEEELLQVAAIAVEWLLTLTETPGY